MKKIRRLSVVDLWFLVAAVLAVTSDTSAVHSRPLKYRIRIRVEPEVCI